MINLSTSKPSLYDIFYMSTQTLTDMSICPSITQSSGTRANDIGRGQGAPWAGHLVLNTYMMLDTLNNKNLQNYVLKYKPHVTLLQFDHIWYHSHFTGLKQQRI